MNSSVAKTGQDASRLRRMQQSAAEWLSLEDRGLSRTQQEELSRWLEADERHARIFAQMRETWSLLDEAGETKAAAAFDPEIDALPPRRRTIRRWLPVTLAAAAALAVAFIGWWRPSGADPVFSATAVTETGRTEIVNLPDGSMIQLNTDSAVVARYGRSDRQVRLLRGEAHFIVARDTAHPFTVVANRVAVRAVGTAFNVRLQPAKVEVLVTEGRVRVDPDAAAFASEPSSPRLRSVSQPALITAGQEASIPFSALVVASASPVPVVIAPVSPDQIERKLAWRQRKIEFVAAPLAEIVAEFNRHNRIKLVIADADLAARTFGGSFQANDPGTFVHLLETTYGIVADRQGDKISLRPGRLP